MLSATAVSYDAGLTMNIVLPVALYVDVAINVTTSAFLTEMETKLARLYRMAFERQARWVQGEWIRRVRRAVSDGNVTVQVQTTIRKNRFRTS